MIGLTPRQHELLVFIWTHMKTHGVAPSFKEMRLGLRCASNARIQEMLSALEDKGCIRRLFNQPRAIEVLIRPQLHGWRCDCTVCKYAAQLKMVQALKVDPPVAILQAKRTNIRPLSVTTRAAFLGIASGRPAPRTRKAVTPREAS